MDLGAANLSLDLGMLPNISPKTFPNHGVFQVLHAKALRTHDKRDQGCSPKPARSLQENNGEGLHLEGWKEMGVGGLEFNFYSMIS